MRQRLDEWRTAALRRPKPRLLTHREVLYEWRHADGRQSVACTQRVIVSLDSIQSGWATAVQQRTQEDINLVEHHGATVVEP